MRRGRDREDLQNMVHDTERFLETAGKLLHDPHVAFRRYVGQLWSMPPEVLLRGSSSPRLADSAASRAENPAGISPASFRADGSLKSIRA